MANNSSIRPIGRNMKSVLRLSRKVGKWPLMNQTLGKTSSFVQKGARKIYRSGTKKLFAGPMNRSFP
ncbi:HAMP domain-containing protein [Sesbania bispinosa]|nr:HAMP domain-containing protein [Sesbania bispinosa]